MRRDSSCSSGGKTEDSLGRACVGPPRDDAKAHRTWDRGRRSSSSSSSSTTWHTRVVCIPSVHSGRSIMGDDCVIVGIWCSLDVLSGNNLLNKNPTALRSDQSLQSWLRLWAPLTLPCNSNGYTRQQPVVSVGSSHEEHPTDTNVEVPVTTHHNRTQCNASD